MMDRVPILVFIPESILECIITLYLGLAIIGVPSSFYRVFPAAVLSSLLSYLVRYMPFPYGVHTLIGVIVNSVLFLMFFKLTWLQGAIASIAAMFILVSTELALFPLIKVIFSLGSFQEVWHDPILRTVVPLFELFLLGGMAYLLTRFRITLINLFVKKGRYARKELAKK